MTVWYLYDKKSCDQKTIALYNRMSIIKMIH